MKATSSNRIYINVPQKNKDLIGTWVTDKKDLKVQVFEVNGIYYGILLEFVCNHKLKLPLNEHKDNKNPNANLRSRAWMNSIILTGLKNVSLNKWADGFIYDFNSGKTYNATVTLSNDILTVRGYVGFELLGKTLIFKRIVG